MNQVIGLRINYVPSEIGPEYLRLRADVTVDYGTPSRTFITSPEIREALTKAQMGANQEFGKILLEYSKRERTLDWRQYFPIPQTKGTPREEFVKLGIAAAIEARVEREARKRFPEIREVMHWHPSWLREAQLKNRGFSIWEIGGKVKPDAYAKALRDKLAKDHRRKRALRNIKK